MRNRIRALAAACAIVAASSVALAHEPTVAQLDAAARAAGNRRDVADRIGMSIFATPWPAEVSQVSANALGDHLIVGIRVLGVKFHHSITREEFESQIIALIERASAVAPEAEEVDVWASVPIPVAKGVVVSGDLAKPTAKTVFSVTGRRGESAAALRARMSAAEGGVFWDERWVRSAFGETPHV